MEGVGVAEHPRLDTVSPESKEPGRGWRRAQAGQAIRRKADSGVWGGEVVGKGGGGASMAKDSSLASCLYQG